jgi:uncharacterized protein YecA (UPF0149 family)
MSFRQTRKEISERRTAEVDARKARLTEKQAVREQVKKMLVNSEIKPYVNLIIEKTKELLKQARATKCIPMRSFTVRRNKPCPCKSGKKYKFCCIEPINMPRLLCRRPGTPTPVKPVKPVIE